MSPRQTVLIYLPDGYATADEFAKDFGFEIVRPEPLPWDSYANRSYEPVEKMAQEVYANFVYYGPGSKPDWQPGGNSEKQDDARQIARRTLRAIGYTPEPTP